MAISLGHIRQMTGFGLTFTSYFRSQSLCTISHEPVGNNLLNAFFTSESQNRYTLRSFQNICEALIYLLDKIYIRFSTNPCVCGL